MTPSIVVVGSANADLVVTVDRLPHAGETITGGDLREVPGGKGANQAVAAARLGAHVAFVGCVGDDAHGRMLSESLSTAGVDVTHLTRTTEVPTGTALIAVDARGENQIIVSPAANHRLDVEMLTGARRVIADADLLLLQLEIPMEAVVAAAKWATGRVLLNPAPATVLSDDLIGNIDLLLPNRSELGLLAGVDEPRTEAEVSEAAEGLGLDAVVTLGAAGALIVSDNSMIRLAAPVVDAVDATAAGDSFCGAMAVELVAGSSLAEAAAFAVRVGAATVMRAGAQPSLPTRDETDRLLA